MFFSDNFHAIKDSHVVLEMDLYVIVVGLMGSPILGIYTKWLFRKRLLKDKIKIPEVNYGMCLISSWLFFISLLIVFSMFDTFHICFPKGICP